MHQATGRRVRPALKELIVEASRALARLDAGRLEELALSCQTLNQELPSNSPHGMQLVQEVREAARDMAVFARVLDATRANLQVMSRLRRAHLERLEYSAEHGAGEWSWKSSEGSRGDN